MENAVDALKMAAAVLIFILAIGASFSLFGTAKQTADSIIGMRDKQKYLDSPNLEDGILYTSSEKIQKEATVGSKESQVTGITINGDRIVNVDDVIATIYRYNKEKYGVTIVDSSGSVIVRFDSNTENLMRQYYNIDFTKNDSEGNNIFQKYVETINNNTNNIYVHPKYECNSSNRKKDNTLYTLYHIVLAGGASDAGEQRISCGAPWYGNEEEIKNRINSDLRGSIYTLNGQTYQGKGLYNKLKNASMIIEVINEIDQSKYLKDDNNTTIETELLQEYKMPTVEIVYILY